MCGPDGDGLDPRGTPIGLLSRQVWADRIRYETQKTADPVRLVRLFGIHADIAVRYVHAAHPDKDLPRSADRATPRSCARWETSNPAA